MVFKLNSGTDILYRNDTAAVKNAVNILKRDISRCFIPSNNGENYIVLKENTQMDCEEFLINVSEEITIYASDELGFVYGLLYISEKFLGIQPFWFWMDQKIEKTDSVNIEYGQYHSPKPMIKYRGWFINDEVLIMKWKINGDSTEPWRMVFEALLRCSGNMVIPGTDKNSLKYRRLASDMGLWITHHHAEPLGAEMFTRLYPDTAPNYAETPELFHNLWEDGIKEQKDMKVIWALGFRGQGDCPFWSNDSSGRFDTPEKQGKLISDIIKLQKQLIQKYVDNPVFCTNLYGEIMELYDKGYITLDDDIIKVSADNGYGKMVTRRRDNHTSRISSMLKERTEHGGIYYHVSFYDLQAANHITMLPNSVDFVNKELDNVIRMNMTDYWIINCSNIRPHVYYLDAVRKKWFGENTGDESHSSEFTDTYYEKNKSVAEIYRDYHKAMIAYGSEEDEYAGEQFYTENVRLLIHSFFNGKANGTPGLKWLIKECPLDEQVRMYTDFSRRNLDNITDFYKKCTGISNSLKGDMKRLFDATVFMQVSIHYYCTIGVIAFGDGYSEYIKGNYKKAFLKMGDSAKAFYTADNRMRSSEYGVWEGFYFNDCFADIKHTGYMLEKMMGYVRERGDNARHDKWYRDAVYAPEDREVRTLLVNDNHMSDRELYEAFKEKEKAEVQIIDLSEDRHGTDI